MKKTLALLLLLAGLTLEAQGKTLTWDGTKSYAWNSWDANWLDEDGKAAVFDDGDNVVFNNNAKEDYIRTYSVEPGSMVVENGAGHTYFFTSANGDRVGGGFKGNMSLIKKGDGKLELDMSNPYDGGTYIYGGSVLIYTLGALGSGDIHLHGGLLSLSIKEKIDNDIFVEGNATLVGCTNGVLTLCEKSTLTMGSGLDASDRDDVIIMDGATLDLGMNSISLYQGGVRGSVQVGDSFIGKGAIFCCKVNVAAGKTLTLLENTSATDGTNFNLGEGSSLDMGGNSVRFADTTVSSSGDGGYLGHGTIEGDLTVTSGSRINLLDNTTITGGVNLGDNASLNLGKNAVTGAVTLSGSATIGNGTIEGDMAVAEGKSLALLENTTITGSITLNNPSSLDLGGNTFHIGGMDGNRLILNGNISGVGNGTLNGELAVNAEHTLTLCGNLDGTGAVSLAENATLNLGGYALTKAVTLAGNATIGNGSLVSDLTVAAGKSLSLLENTAVTGAVTLADTSSLNLGGNTLTKAVTLAGNATIGNGTINADLTVAAGKTLTLSGNLAGEGDILLGEGATLNLNNKSLTNTITLIGESANIGNCSFSQGLTVAADKRINLLNGTDIHGGVTLKDKATLDLGKNTLSTGNAVILEGDAGIGNGTIKCGLTVAAGKTLSLLQNTTLYYNTLNVGVGATVDFGGNSLLNVDFVFAGDATIGNGTLNRDITVESGNKLTLCGAMDGAGIINLKAESTLDLNQYALSNMLLVGDSVTIGNGALNVDVRLGGQMQLNLCGDLGGTGVIHLDNGTTLNLGGHTLTKEVSVLAGNSTTIANGTVKLLADLTGEGTIVFGEDTMVDMNGYTLSRAFSLAGDTTFTNGKVRLTDDVSGEGTFILGEGVTLDTNFRTISNKITLSGSTVTILGGNFDNDLTVGKGQTLIVTGTSMTGKGTLYLGDGATLRQKPTPISSYITNAVMVTGNATIDNGNLSSWVTVAPGVKLTVSGSLNMANSSSIALQDGAILDLGGGSDINARVYVGGDAFVGNGCVNKEILVNSLRKLTLFDSLTCIDIGSQETSTGITLQNNAAVDLGGKTHIIDVRAYGNASIGNGTLDGSVTANHDSSLNFFGETRIKGGTQIPGGTQNPDKTATSGLVTVGNTTIKSLDNANPGLLKELSVSNGLIAGTDRCTSLADGLYIESTAALMIKNMTITANNELHAGYMLTNTVTLNQVTIDLSEANFKLVGSDYYFQVQDLINCTLEMDDVVFDASALELPEDFDPDENGIGFDFGDDVFIGKTEATLLMGDHWSQTVSLGDRGQMVFSALVPMTPEPTTGTLGLLALATLAARRRRK